MASSHQPQFGLMNSRTFSVFISSLVLLITCRFRDKGITMFVRWRTAAEEFQCVPALIPELVLLAGRDRDGVTGLDIRHFPFDAHSGLAGQDEINLLGAGVVMLLRATAGR